jgi:putative hydrolase of the HAD superfamily
MAAIRAILFDADGVIQHSVSAFGERLAGLLGPAHPDGQRFIAEVFAAEKPALSGERDFAQDLAVILAHYRVARPVSEVLELWTSIECDPAMHDAIVSLRGSGMLCCLASNQQAHRGRYMSSQLHYRELFDREFYSYQLGFAKPDPEYFRAIERALGIAASQLLFIDDSAPNIAGAREAGLHASLFSADFSTSRALLQTILAEHGLALPCR